MPARKLISGSQRQAWPERLPQTAGPPAGVSSIKNRYANRYCQMLQGDEWVSYRPGLGDMKVCPWARHEPRMDDLADPNQPVARHARPGVEPAKPMLYAVGCRETGLPISTNRTHVSAASKSRAAAGRSDSTALHRCHQPRQTVTWLVQIRNAVAGPANGGQEYHAMQTQAMPKFQSLR